MPRAANAERQKSWSHLLDWAKENGFPAKAIADIEKKLGSPRAERLEPLIQPVADVLVGFPSPLVEFMIQIRPRNEGLARSLNRRTPGQQIADAQMRFIFDCAIASIAGSIPPARHALHRHLLNDLRRYASFAAPYLETEVPAYFGLPSVPDEDALFLAIATYFICKSEEAIPAVCQEAAEQCRVSWTKRLRQNPDTDWAELTRLFETLQEFVPLDNLLAEKR